jgi:pimeloyl-ACP methyl ester carboxylesterase
MELNFKVFGNGQPIIILHGMFGTLDNWQGIAKKLAVHYMVFIVDLRNHGRSAHSANFSYEIMSEDLRLFMENNWIYKAHIIGHSMGGKVAMHFASEYPEMIDKLIVVDIAPKTYQGNHQTIFKALLDLNPAELSSRKEASTKLAEWIDDAAVRQFILKNLYLHKTTERYTWRMNLEVIHRSYEHILSNSLDDAQFDGPTLFVRGERSDYIQLNEWSLCQSYFPNAQLSSIAKAGHWVHAEQAQSFLNVVNTFLND